MNNPFYSVLKINITKSSSSLILKAPFFLIFHECKAPWGQLALQWYCWPVINHACIISPAKVGRTIRENNDIFSSLPYKMWKIYFFEAALLYLDICTIDSLFVTWLWIRFVSGSALNQICTSKRFEVWTLYHLFVSLWTDNQIQFKRLLQIYAYF